MRLREQYRRFCFEPLEQRAMLSVMRLVSWNTANEPDDTTEDALYKTIFEAIGNETAAGITKRVDILALQETDIVGSGANSIGRIESVLNGLYPGGSYDSTVSALDGGGDGTGFVYDTTTVSLLDSIQVPGQLTHSVQRGQFRPQGTSGESDFFVYSVHLKAGASSNDATRRSSEASILRVDADALGDGTSVLIVGDFNLQDSFENAFTTFTASGPAQMHDPINALGNWHDNPTFLNVHTQNPQDPGLGGGGMDDRFDLQLMSGEFFDGVGIDYVPDSYRAFANNGTHILNGSITSGTGAAPNVLAALAQASDHLPIVADYEVFTTTAGVSIRQSNDQSTVLEGAAFDTYSVVLNTRPSADVTLTVSPDAQLDLGQGPGMPVALDFTPANAQTPQTVVVTATDDSLQEGTHVSTLVHTSSSTDPAYDALTIDDVVVTILDNDRPTIVINEIDADTEGVDALEFVELYDGGIGSVALEGMTLVLFNGATDTSYAALDLDGYSTNSDGFFVLGNASVLSVDFVIGDSTIQNGADAIALFTGDAANFPNGTAVTTAGLIDAVVYDTDDADDSGLLPLLNIDQPQVNENENGNRVVESLARIPDGGTPRNSLSFAAQFPTPGALNSPTIGAISLAESGGRTDVAEGGFTDSYTLALNVFPTTDVMIVVDPDQQSDIGNGPGNPATLTFTSQDGLLPQTVTVTAVDDADIEQSHSSRISHTVITSDIDFSGLVVRDVVVNITDNEPPPVIDVVISEIMYNPDSDETAPGVAEWIEIVNLGNTIISLAGWSFADEDGTWGALAAGVALEVNQVAIVYDQSFTTESEFRAAWGIPTSVEVLGVDWGSLANGPSATNEVLELRDSSGITVDNVNYDDSGDWPSDSPDGPSIYLTDLAADNNVGTHWARSVVGTDDAISPLAGVFSNADVGSPGLVPGLPLAGDFNGDGAFDCVDIDALVAVIAAGSFDSGFDLDGSGTLDLDDVLAWLNVAGAANLAGGGAYQPGDANLDGQVDAKDFDIWNANRFTNTAAWCSGDFTADGAVDLSDLHVWNEHRDATSSASQLDRPRIKAVGRERLVPDENKASERLTAVIDRVFEFDSGVL